MSHLEFSGRCCSKWKGNLDHTFLECHGGAEEFDGLSSTRELASSCACGFWAAFHAVYDLCSSLPRRL